MSAKELTTLVLLLIVTLVVVHLWSALMRPQASNRLLESLVLGIHAGIDTAPRECLQNLSHRVAQLVR